MFTSRQRANEEREARLDDIREQVYSGVLVIRAMTKVERAKWTRQRAKLESKWTPEERGRRENALQKRRGHSARIT